MNAGKANVINAAVLILMGLWAYLTSDSPSVTALIPSFIGVVLMLLANGVNREDKVQAHIAVVLTLLVFVMLLAKPLPARIAAGDTIGTIRVGLQVLTSGVAMFFFIKSFRDARLRREGKL